MAFLAFLPMKIFDVTLCDCVCRIESQMLEVILCGFCGLNKVIEVVAVVDCLSLLTMMQCLCGNPRECKFY